MSRPARFLEFVVFAGITFVLSQALLPLILSPGDTPTDGNPIYKMVFAVSYLAAAAILISHYRDTLFVTSRNIVLVVLILFAVASFAWADSPALVLQRSIAVLGTTLFGLAMAVRLSTEEQLRLMSWVLRITAVLSLLAVIAAPRYGISPYPHLGDWRGIFNHKNALGGYMALSVLVEWHVRARSTSEKFLRAVAFLLSATLLVFSNSITSLVTAVASLVFIEIYKAARQRLRIPAFAIVSVISLGVASVVAMLVADSETITSVLGRSSNLTGRTEIWRWVMVSVMERPIFGYGYNGFWAGASAESLALDRRLGTPIMYAHNGYLEICLTLGAVGLLLSLIFLGFGIKRAFERSESSDSNVNSWPMAFLFFFMLHNVAECTILFQGLEWALCVATIASADAALHAPLPQAVPRLAFSATSECT
jgi:exopolysaccharide production protein ExoQ